MDTSLLQMYRSLVRARVFDEISLAMQRQGALDTYASARGQEAAHIGASSCLQDGDWMFPSYRQQGSLLQRGVTPEQLWDHYAGAAFVAWDWRRTRCGPFAIPLATQLAHATGAAWGSRLQGGDEVVLAFFGDGASSQGEAHEAMNFAGVMNAPVVFVCENNGWAISVPWSRQSKATHIADRAQGYGFPGVVQDGQDALAVRAVVADAVARARQGGGPTLVELTTMRLEGHTTSDDPKIYRDDGALDPWRSRDPVELLAEAGLASGDLDRQRIDETHREFQTELREAFARWQTSRGRA